MFIWVIVIIAFAIFFMYKIWDCLGGIVETIFGGFVGIVLGIAASFVLCVVLSGIILQFANTEDVVTSSKELSAINYSTETSGSFFLGCGSVSGNQYYYYIENTENGMSIKKMDVDGVYLRYSDIPRIEEHTYLYTNWILRDNFVTFKEYTVIYVPEGSVVQDYTIDLN